MPRDGEETSLRSKVRVGSLWRVNGLDIGICLVSPKEVEQLDPERPHREPAQKRGVFFYLSRGKVGGDASLPRPVQQSRRYAVMLRERDDREQLGLGPSPRSIRGDSRTECG